MEKWHQEAVICDSKASRPRPDTSGSELAEQKFVMLSWQITNADMEYGLVAMAHSHKCVCVQPLKPGKLTFVKVNLNYEHTFINFKLHKIKNNNNM
jgi:hypothetical protein